jgi:hypothetical protein
MAQHKEIKSVGKLPDFVESEYIVVEFSDKAANLDFQHLFDKGLSGKYKIVLEKINGTA